MTDAVELSEFADRLEIGFGETSSLLCRVYAQLKWPDRPRSLQLAGTLTGPHCAYARTLGATYRFVDRGSPSWLSAEAAVPEPCNWTPEMPQLYDAQLELRDGQQVLVRERRIFGIRPLVAVRDLIYAGKKWVLRSVLADEVPPTDLAEWHDADTAMCVRNPNDALCDAASRAGVLLVAQLSGPELREIRRLRRWPAVGIIAVTGSETMELEGMSRQVVLAQQLAERQPDEPAAWRQAIISPSDAVGQLADAATPIIAIRPAGKLTSVAEGRRACDQLQRNLAQQGQFAGYIV